MGASLYSKKNMRSKVISICAGKGGVGKTFVSAGLAITLARMKFSVIIIDFDLAGANVHTNFGVAPNQRSIQNFLSREVALADLVFKTSIPRVSMIQGVWQEWENIHSSPEQVARLVTESKKLPFDYVIIDLGPGPTPANLELFTMSDERILITTADPTSIEKNYRFLEAWMIYRISRNMTERDAYKIKTTVKTFREQKHTGIFSFRDYLNMHAGVPFDLFDKMRSETLQLVVNECRSRLDQDLGYSIKSVCRKYFDIGISYLGSIDYDNAVWQCLRNHEAFLVARPFSGLSAQFMALAKIILNQEGQAATLKAVV